MSPYLKDYRIQDIVAALQITGSYKKYKMSAAEWEDKIENMPLSADNWECIFKEHLEFFRENNKGLFSLMWRRGLPHDEKGYREALSTDQINILIDTANRFHSAASEGNKWSVEQIQNEKRWKQQMGLSVLTALLALVSATLAAWIKISSISIS